MYLPQIKGWQQFIKEGEQYLRTAVNAAVKRREVFTSEILYNVTGMAIEKYLMGLLMFHGELADNHTMADLARAVEGVVGEQKKLTAKLLFLDSFQEICSVDTYSRKVPSDDDIVEILAIGRDVQAFVAARVTA